LNHTVFIQHQYFFIRSNVHKATDSPKDMKSSTATSQEIHLAH